MQTHHGFILKKCVEIKELKTTASLFEHKKTKAQMLSLVNADENKSFGITFRTPPPDSTGVAHILEHSVLCGSKNYPLKEPFIELVKGSLNTFLNAFTYPDKTSYPVASTNRADFYNLVRVYLDAVFFPILSKETLMQEGWHPHQEKSDDAPLFKGVVFNEMKGAYNSPDRALWDTLQATLLPDTPYVHDSGGDPLCIPDLRYEQFVAFHQTYYHPSNAYLFFSGDDPEEDRLALADEYLSAFSYKAIESVIPLQKKFDTPKTVHAPLVIGPHDDPIKKGIVTMGWVLDPVTDLELTLRWSVLSHILLGTGGSPLRKVLTESGIGEDIAGGGIEHDLAQMIFSVGLKGMDVARASEVESLIIRTLEGLVREGIPEDATKAALHTIEFALREQNSGSFPRGLSMLYGMLESWITGADPIEALSFETLLSTLKTTLASGERVFEELIETGLLFNTHRATVIMDPDAKEQERREGLEQKRLGSMDTSSALEATRKLLALQEKPDDGETLRKLPRLSRQDLKQSNTPIPIEKSESEHGTVLLHPIPTNGIVYVNLVFDLHGVSAPLLPLLPLFARSLFEMGTSRESYDHFIHRQSMETGGVDAGILTSAKWQSPGTVAKLVISAKCLATELEQTLLILRDGISDADLTNKERFLQMLLEEKTTYETGILEDGHQFAASRIQCQFHETDWLEEQLSGVEQLLFLRNLVKKVETQWGQVEKNLLKIKDCIFRQDVLLNITADPGVTDDVARACSPLLSELSHEKKESAAWPFVPTARSEILQVHTNVNYVGKGCNLYELGYQFDGSAFVIAKYLRTAYLWEQVRMKGGAYGAFVSFDPLSGTFAFLSYRDPRLLETIAVFDETAAYLKNLQLSDDELTKTIIGAISEYDKYLLPDAKGVSSMTRHLVGMTDERRAKTREEILGTTLADFHAFGETLEQLAKTGIVAVVSSSNATIPGDFREIVV